MFKNFSLLKFGRLRKKFQSPSKRRALNFLGSGGGDPSDEATGTEPVRRGGNIQENPISRVLNPNVKADSLQILDFFGSKRTARTLRGAVSRLRDSLVNTFDMAAILKAVILGITKKLEGAPGKIGGGGGGLGILGFLKKGIISLVGGLGAKILGILGGIISLIPMFAGFVMPALVLGGITFAVTNEDFRNKIQSMLPGSETDEEVDESIEEVGGQATADRLREEQAEKRANRNAFQNFFFGKIMGEDAEYEKQIKKAEEAEASGITGKEKERKPQVQSTTDVLGRVTSTTGAAGNTAIEKAMNMIRKKEGFEEDAYWDVNAFRAGYGSDTYTTETGEVKRVTQNTKVTREDAERDIKRRTKIFMEGARRDIGPEIFDKLDPNAQAALTSIAYNYGSVPERVTRVAKSSGGDREAIAVAVEGLKGDDKGINAARRQAEADIIRKLSITPQQEETRLKDGENVSAVDTSATREIAMEDTSSNLGEIAFLPIPMGGGEPQKRQSSGEQITNPTADPGGSPSIAFLTPFNPDRIDEINTKLMLGIVAT